MPPDPTEPSGTDADVPGPDADAPGPDAEPRAPAGPTPASRPGPGRRYRTPRYSVFLFSGSAAGLLVGVALALYGGGDTVTTGAGVLGYFSAFGLIVGALAGGTLAVVVESAMNRGRRRGSGTG